jgi:hypothetical protein
MQHVIVRSFTDYPLAAGIWVSDVAIAVAVNGRVTLAAHRHLSADTCHVLATVLAEAGDYLDGRMPGSVFGAPAT